VESTFKSSVTTNTAYIWVNR